jgi:hypothetical protein
MHCMKFWNDLVDPSISTSVPCSLAVLGVRSCKTDVLYHVLPPSRDTPPPRTLTSPPGCPA